VKIAGSSADLDGTLFDLNLKGGEGNGR
jgi:hypothetical protein